MPLRQSLMYERWETVTSDVDVVIFQPVHVFRDPKSLMSSLALSFDLMLSWRILEFDAKATLSSIIARRMNSISWLVK